MSHLTVSYVSQTPPGTAPAGAPAPAAGAPDEANPLGFLGALIDQLLAGSDAQKIAAAAGAAAPAVSGLFGLPAAGAEPAPSDPLTAATAQLDALAARIEAGASPAPGDLERLQLALGAVATAEPPHPETDLAGLRDRLGRLAEAAATTDPGLAGTLQAFATQLSPATLELAGDPDLPLISNILRTLLGHPAKPTEAKDDAANPAATTADELLRILAALGLNGGPATAPASAAPTGDEGTNSATVPAPLLRLSNQLGTVSAAIVSAHPELAQKLDTLAARIVSGDVDPNLLGKLTSAAAGTDEAALDRLVQSLIDARPAPPAAPTSTPPQIAGTELPVPAPITSKDQKSAPAKPDPLAPVADAAPERPARPEIVVTRDRDPRPEAHARPESKATVIAEASKPDPAPSAPAQPATAAPPQVHQPRIIPTAYQQAANPINMGQVAFEMVRQVQQGTSRFTIRLDPPELGRVDVRMHVDPSGGINARLTVDRPETLDLFQRDQRQLERALAQAGLDSSRTSLEFSLRQNHQNPFAGLMDGNRQQQHSGSGHASRFSTESDEIASPPAITLYRGIASAGGVNIVA